MHTSRRVWLGLIAVVLLGVLLATPWVGSTPVAWSDVIHPFAEPQSLGGQVLWTFRLPRIAMAALAGASLAVAGAVFQATFRNPLADPFTLGVASGAAVGATVALFLGWDRVILGLSTTTLAAMAGAFATVLIVYGLAGAWRHGGTYTLLLAGLSIAFICSAVILLLQYVGRGPVTNETVRWLMGSCAQAGWSGVLSAAPLAILGGGVVGYLHRDLDLLMMGELVAAGRGVNPGRARTIAYFAASAMTAAVVAHCGPIAFVGLVIPHIVRAAGGASHAFVIPASAMAGAAFLIACDTVAARLLAWTSGSPMQVPVGVATNLIGGVFFLCVLLGRRRSAQYERM